MDIMVEGRAKRTYKADEVEIRFEFKTTRVTYEMAVEDGSKNVESFINDVLLKMDFSKEDMKTQSFRVYEEINYNYQLQKEEKLGFTYSQCAILKFDYSIEKVAEMISKVCKISNPPKYFLNFSLKDKESAKNEVLADAYLNAKKKAQVIANVAELSLKSCVKTDFKPFTEKVISNTNLEAPAILGKAYSVEQANMVKGSIQTSFTPQDIEISETIYCLWLAE